MPRQKFTRSVIFAKTVTPNVGAAFYGSYRVKYGLPQPPPNHGGQTRDGQRMLSGHKVHFIDDQKMPNGHDWAIAQVGDGMVCLLRASAITPTVLEEAWEGYRELAAPPSRPSRLMRFAS